VLINFRKSEVNQTNKDFFIDYKIPCNINVVHVFSWLLHILRCIYLERYIY